MLGGGLSLGDLLAGQSRGDESTLALDPSFWSGQGVHRPLPDGRPRATFDLGPQARRTGGRSAETFGPIATKVPGISIGELLPMTARHTDKLAILRSVSTGDNAHSSSGYYMLTGRPSLSR